MAFALRHKLTTVAVQDLLNLMNANLPGCIPATAYFMDRLLNGADNGGAVLHYCCKNRNCMQHFGPVVPDYCSTCSERYLSDGDSCNNFYMLVLPLE
jgi:hypothetical protein